MARSRLVLCALLLGWGLACGDDTPPAKPPVPTVSVTCDVEDLTLAAGGTHTFHVTVGGTANTAVTWSVQEGAAGGSVTADGVYTAPAQAGTYHVVVASVADPSKRAVVTVVVTAPPLDVRVGVTPDRVTLDTGASQAFTATVTGTANTAVTWSVQEGAAGGTVSAAGSYTAPATAGTYHVVATSVADPTRSAAATVTVTAPPAGVRVVWRATDGTLVGVAGVTVHRNDPATGAHLGSAVTDGQGRADFGTVSAARTTYSLVRPAEASDAPVHVVTFASVPAQQPVRLRLDRMPGGATVLGTLSVEAQAEGLVLPSGLKTATGPGALQAPLRHGDLQSDGRTSVLAWRGGVESTLYCGSRMDVAVPPTGGALSLTMTASPWSVDYGSDGVAMNATPWALRKDAVLQELEGWAYRTTGSFDTCLGALPDVERFGVWGQGSEGVTQATEGYDLVETRLFRRRLVTWPGPTLRRSVNLTPGDLRVPTVRYDGEQLQGPAAGALAASVDAVVGELLWTADGTDYHWHVLAPPSATGTVVLPTLPSVTRPAWRSGVRARLEAYAVAEVSGYDAVWEGVLEHGSLEAFLARAGAADTGRATVERRTPSYAIGFEGYAWIRYGTVRSRDGRIDCGASCATGWPAGTTVTFDAIPNPGAVFNYWGGECASYGSQPTIDILVDRDIRCAPSFGPAGDGSYALTVYNAGAWPVLIRSNDGLITCGQNPQGQQFTECWTTYRSGYRAVLSATPAMQGPYNMRWVGDCTGTGAGIDVILDRSRSCGVELTVP